MFVILIIAEITILTEAASSNWYQIGCFVDDWYRDMEDGPVEYGYNVDTCFVACSSYLYFALQDGGLCSCGNDYSTSSKYYEVDASECGEEGLGGYTRNMVYGIVSAVTMDSKYWWCSGECSISFGTGSVNEGESYMETYATFVRPLNLTFEIKNVGSTVDCGVLALFPVSFKRHSGYTVGVEWWAKYFGFGVDGEINRYEYVSDYDWHTITIEATETQVLAYYQGVLQATLDDSKYMSGKIRIGYNCGDYEYKNFLLNGGINVQTSRPSVSPTSSPSMAPTTVVPSMEPTTTTATTTTTTIEATEDTITLLGLDMTHGMAEIIMIALVFLLICLCIPTCIVCFWTGKKVEQDIRDSACELTGIQQKYDFEIMQGEYDDIHQTENKLSGEI